MKLTTLILTLLLATPSSGSLPADAGQSGAPHGAAEEVVAGTAAASPVERKRGGAPLPTAETGAIPGSVLTSMSASLRDGRTGVIAHTGSSSPYLAIPLGSGVRVLICAVRCLEATSSDAGPNHEMLVAGRIADLDIPRWERVCGKPASAGLCRGSWHVIGAEPSLPPTDTEDDYRGQYETYTTYRRFVLKVETVFEGAKR